MTKEGKRIVIIGAGFGGLSAAAYLAQAGYDVTVLEKNKTNSAQNRVVKKKSFTFDLNTSWYLMPDVFDDFFRDFGTSAHEQYDAPVLTPGFKIFTHETDYEVTTWPDIAELFDALEPGSGDHLNKLLHRAEKQYRHFRQELANNPDAPKLPQILKPSLRRPYHELIAKSLKNQDLQHLLEVPSLMMGANPQTLPGAFQYINYATLAMGVARPQGGLPAVAAAMQKIAKQAGAKIRFGAPVNKIIVDSNVVSGVQVKDDIIPCDVVIANADMQWVENQLLDQPFRSYHERYWEKRELTPSAIVACLGVNRPLPELKVHNVLLDNDWDMFLGQIFGSRDWSPKPIVFINNASKQDGKVAPKNSESLVIHIPLAAGMSPSDEQLERLLLSVIGRLQEQLGYEFMNDVAVADIKPPEYFEDEYHAFRGSLGGLSPTLAQLTKHRPPVTSRKVGGLYYLGGYSTPGSLPAIAVAQGKSLSDLIAS